MRTGADLETFCRQHGLAAQVIYLKVLTPTVAAAAQAVGCEVDEIVKSILVIVNGEPQLVVANGERRISFQAVAALNEVSRKRVRLATAEEVQSLTGYPVGALPPFGHPQPLRTLLDAQVLAQVRVYAGGGAENALLLTNPQEIRAAAAAEIAELTTPATG
jgi:prolyl-tRNA editing enzyme YbaK/EbsC (Cys-tRNA(Pro) deacylase)